jgi:hypothetical protein
MTNTSSFPLKRKVTSRNSVPLSYAAQYHAGFSMMLWAAISRVKSRPFFPRAPRDPEGARRPVQCSVFINGAADDLWETLYSKQAPIGAALLFGKVDHTLGISNHGGSWEVNRSDLPTGLKNVGGHLGLQIRYGAIDVPGGFDSHTFPPLAYLILISIFYDNSMVDHFVLTN